jgi:hypothetical protein
VHSLKAGRPVSIIKILSLLISVTVNMKTFAVLTIIKLNHRVGRKERRKLSSEEVLETTGLSVFKAGCFLRTGYVLSYMSYFSFPFFTLPLLVAIILVVWADTAVNIGPYRRYEVRSSELKLLIKLPASRAECKTLRF